jgi:hypothetical protein
MSYLARLKQIEDKNIYHNTPDTVLTKPTKPPFGSFGSSHTGHIENNLSDNAVLRDLVLEVMVLVGELPADWQYYVDLALIDPVNALTCYTALKRELVADAVTT